MSRVVWDCNIRTHKTKPFQGQQWKLARLIDTKHKPNKKKNTINTCDTALTANLHKRLYYFSNIENLPLERERERENHFQLDRFYTF